MCYIFCHLCIIVILSLHIFLLFFFLMIRRPPRSTRTDTLFPYTTLFRSVWIQDRQGRWLRGTAFYNINNMWYVAIGKYELHNMAAFRIHVSKPASLRRQPNLKARRARLEEEFRKAVAGMDFERAKLLQKFLFGEQDVFRIWARQKDAWYRQQAQGRSEERRVGNECVSTGRSRWSPTH